MNVCGSFEVLQVILAAIDINKTVALRSHPPSITTDSPPHEASLSVCRTSIVMRAVTTTPVGMTGAFLTFFPVIVGLPRYYGVSAPTTAFRGLLSVTHVTGRISY